MPLMIKLEKNQFWYGFGWLIECVFYKNHR